MSSQKLDLGFPEEDEEQHHDGQLCRDLFLLHSLGKLIG